MAAGNEYIIRLKPKMSFLTKNIPVFTYDSKGNRIESQPYIPVECYHEGYVEGEVESLVALSTCNGLKGYLKIRDKDYGIEPIEDSLTFQHLLYLTEEVETNSSVSRMRTKEVEWQTVELKRQSRSFGAIPSNPKHPKYIELYVVVDNAMFLMKSSNQTTILYLVLDVINMVDAQYHLLNTHITLIGLEIWTNGNHISDSKDIRTVLDNFNNWRLRHFTKFPSHDTTHLFIHQNFSNIFGTSYKSAICNQKLSAGVEAYVGKDLVLFSKAISHELGHHLGLEDDDRTCFCGTYRDCIMSSSHATVSMFSNCSVETFLELSLNKRLECLNNVPKNIDIVQRCGNGVLDIGEECDCGGPRRCKKDACCNLDCTYKGKSTCSSGSCCRNCRYLPNGHICREKVNECDLPEYCSGTSSWCRTDLYVQDGTPCSEHAYCYGKKCWTHNILCKRIFGEETRMASETCFHTLNSMGDAIGNCGTNRRLKKFVKCEEKDIMCGRLHCTDVVIVPNDIKDVKIVRVALGKAKCWSIEYHGNVDRYDVGAVPDGTVCGPKKICMNRTCVSANVLKPTCNAEKKCSGRGVCNNHNNCHCNVGWAPPYCKYWGTGGSIDGGFPLMSWSTSLMRYTFGTVIPLALLAIAAVTVIVPKLWGLMPKLHQWWESKRSRTVKVSDS
ncbi:hypothetical protein JD844_015223 [Phrynosoma platyrhinos]|uniref:Uncharacterized protein n=1 Tax=Phrynosoma platyrhinos TaxID=52577 RepID=A0ABQ7T7P9_PHRPL|nr:hypothetical protein JD844_015223 [Phrynosoma platyrhinos]